MEPPSPMSVVRLLLRRGDDVFCVPRLDSNAFDLPMRPTAAADPDGVTSIAALATSIIGPGRAPRYLGAVRNVVESGGPEYPWPQPVAHFGLWESDHPPLVDGRWLTLRGSDSLLRERHWYPLVSVAEATA